VHLKKILQIYINHNNIFKTIKTFLMKIFLPFLFLILNFSAFSQYPLIENFNSINGPSEWQNLTGQPDVCAHNNTDLCFNCTSPYNTNDVYVAISPNYGNQFVVDLCDSVRITFSVDVNIRPGDVLYVLWRDYLAPGIFGAVVPGTGIWTLQIPPQVELFAFQFETFGTGNPTGRYVHVDWFEIGCINYLLDIDLVTWECNKNYNGIQLTATFSEETELDLEWSETGLDWLSLSKINDIDLNYLHHSNSNSNYYRIKYDNKISNTIFCEETNLNSKVKYVKYFNVLGQEIKEPVHHYLKQTTYENGNVKINLIYKD